MTMATESGLGGGVYPPSEVARLARIEPGRLHRWMHGYDYRLKRTKELRRAPALVQRREGDTLTFLDLLEVCFVKAFLDQGVPMATVRHIETQASIELKTTHPFCMRRFETDGKTIVLRYVAKQRVRLRDMAQGQLLMRQVFEPLLRQIDYKKTTDEAHRWWPAGRRTPS